jgi:hypothetical protein
MSGPPDNASTRARAVIPEDVTPVVVASHRRSGTHLMIDLLRRNFDACRPAFRFGANPHRYLYFVLDRLRPTHPHHVGVEACQRVLRSTEKPALKTHDTPDFEQLDPTGRRLCEAALSHGVVVYCVRDVRAVLASLHAFDAVNGNSGARCLSDYIREEVDGLPRPAVWANHVRAWKRDRPHWHVVQYEHVVGRPREVVERLAEWLGDQPTGVDPILPPKMKHRRDLWLSRFIGMPPSTNVIGQTKTIKPRDWRTAYSDDDIGFLDKHAGEVMRELGYVVGRDWSLRRDHPRK